MDFHGLVKKTNLSVFFYPRGSFEETFRKYSGYSGGNHGPGPEYCMTENYKPKCFPRPDNDGAAGDAFFYKKKRAHLI